MQTMATVIVSSLLIAAAGAGLGFMLIGSIHEGAFLMVLLGSVGAIVGAVAGAAQEISHAVQQKRNSE
ncbi:hypothetical protein [Schlesneria sp. DSM 10557]|uniref:hypothetical protein n=1 Tax=Schlesneria sp. DSM 10557 TaxID=3044399 RepID=UPI0035A1859D